MGFHPRTTKPENPRATFLLPITDQPASVPRSFTCLKLKGSICVSSTSSPLHESFTEYAWHAHLGSVPSWIATWTALADLE